MYTRTRTHAGVGVGVDVRKCVSTCKFLSTDYYSYVGLARTVHVISIYCICAVYVTVYTPYFRIYCT